MKTKFLPVVSVLAVVLLCGCATARPHRDFWFGRDKFYHFGVSAAVAAGTAAEAERRDMTEPQEFTAAIGAVFVVGGAKEGYDAFICNRYWSWKDMAWDILGGIAGFFAVNAVK
jgi:uncharacterized protein YfiM (DUF2279 family)